MVILGRTQNEIDDKKGGKSKPKDEDTTPNETTDETINSADDKTKQQEDKEASKASTSGLQKNKDSGDNQPDNTGDKAEDKTAANLVSDTNVLQRQNSKGKNKLYQKNSKKKNLEDGSHKPQTSAENKTFSNPPNNEVVLRQNAKGKNKQRPNQKQNTSQGESHETQTGAKKKTSSFPPNKSKQNQQKSSSSPKKNQNKKKNKGYNTPGPSTAPDFQDTCNPGNWRNPMYVDQLRRGLSMPDHCNPDYYPSLPNQQPVQPEPSHASEQQGRSYRDVSASKPIPVPPPRFSRLNPTAREFYPKGSSFPELSCEPAASFRNNYSQRGTREDLRATDPNNIQGTDSSIRGCWPSTSTPNNPTESNLDGAFGVSGYGAEAWSWPSTGYENYPPEVTRVASERVPIRPRGEHPYNQPTGALLRAYEETGHRVPPYLGPVRSIKNLEKRQLQALTGQQPVNEIVKQFFKDCYIPKDSSISEDDNDDIQDSPTSGKQNKRFDQDG